jgi:DNA-binding MurR/RpiR family transcriptional regulator
MLFTEHFIEFTVVTERRLVLDLLILDSHQPDVTAKLLDLTKEHWLLLLSFSSTNRSLASFVNRASDARSEIILEKI